MCYMLSKQQYLSDEGGHWHPHLMFFLPLTEPAIWGAGLAGSPVMAIKDPLDQPDPVSDSGRSLVGRDGWSGG